MTDESVEQRIANLETRLAAAQQVIAQTGSALMSVTAFVYLAVPGARQRLVGELRAAEKTLQKEGHEAAATIFRGALTMIESASN